MPSPIQITYLHHSGFAVRTQDTLLVFDDAREIPQGEHTLLDGYVTSALVQAHKRTVIFVSHAHGDHFSPAIYRFAGEAGVTYVLGYDIPAPHPGHRMAPGDTYAVEDICVAAHESTDEGVSFLVQADGWTLFHAGDLNLWHWREESTHKEIEQAERDFHAAMEPLLDIPVDIAFFPVDPRMGTLYDAGALYYLMHVKPQVMLPMHWWTRDDAARDFARRNQTKHVEIVALTQPGETIRARKQPDGKVLIDL